MLATRGPRIAIACAALLAARQDLRAQAAAADAAGEAAVPTIAWTAGPELPLARDHHATFLVQSPGGSFLYVAGGTDYRRFFDDVSRARIGEDGELGPWESAGTLPTPRGGTSVAVVDGFAVLTGGQIETQPGLKGLTRIAEVYLAPIDASGKLGAWVAAPPMPSARFHHPTVVHDGWIYVVGGQGEREAEAGVFAARVQPDGTIREWLTLPDLPRSRSHHAAFADGKYLYVAGGLDGMVGGIQGMFNDVMRAEFLDDGTLGPWQLVSRTPHAYATHAMFAHEGYLWLIGGVEDNMRFVDTVWRAEVGADGRIGGWEAVEPGLPLARGHVHNTPILGERVYSVGGRVAPSKEHPGWVTGAAQVGRFVVQPGG